MTKISVLMLVTLTLVTACSVVSPFAASPQTTVNASPVPTLTYNPEAWAYIAAYVKDSTSQDGPDLISVSALTESEPRYQCPETIKVSNTEYHLYNQSCRPSTPGLKLVGKAKLTWKPVPDDWFDLLYPGAGVYDINGSVTADGTGLWKKDGSIRICKWGQGSVTDECYWYSSTTMYPFDPCETVDNNGNIEVLARIKNTSVAAIMADNELTDVSHLPQLLRVCPGKK